MQNNKYLASQLIAYIGNKRRLLPLIEEAVRLCVPKPDAASVFVDLFAGSGAVAKLAKHMGFSVRANDWELYSSVLNRAFISTNKRDLPGLFSRHGGIARVLQILNALETPQTENIALYYAPRDTLSADPDTERMFYTRENALKIDAIREWIEAEYPAIEDNAIRARERDLLLGLLVYEAATHANTSGVFKAYHRGFGGRGQDALKRIMGEIMLEMPVLIDGEAEIFQEDAAVLAASLSSRKADIVYLDPPYNQHQYGSNYHLLNTIVLNDHPAAASPAQPAPHLKKERNKGGIRKDWVKTRSHYCYKKSAETEFRKLVNSINAKHILVSYSTEGLIPFEKMLKILAARGKLGIVMSEYTRYRGGKQALHTSTRNVEFVLVCSTQAKGGIADIQHIQHQLALHTLSLYRERSVSPAILIEKGFTVAGFSEIDLDLSFSRALSRNLECRLIVNNFKRIVRIDALKCGVVQEPEKLSFEDLQILLESMSCLSEVNHEEELLVTINWAKYLRESGREQGMLQALACTPGLLKKFNDRKAYEASLTYLLRILQLAGECRAAGAASDKKFHTTMQQLEKIARLKLSVHPGAQPPSACSRLETLRSAISRELKI